MCTWAVTCRIRQEGRDALSPFWNPCRKIPPLYICWGIFGISGTSTGTWCPGVMSRCLQPLSNWLKEEWMCSFSVEITTSGPIPISNLWVWSFCLGHGDGLGPVPMGYRILSGIFKSRVLRALFSTLHPWLAFRFGNSWSRRNRLRHKGDYVFRGKDEPLYKFAEEYSSRNAVDFF